MTEIKKLYYELLKPSDDLVATTMKRLLCRPAFSGYVWFIIQPISS